MKKKKNYNKLEKYFIPVFIFLFTLLIYIRNISPSVYGGDSGDLIASAITKGVAHPSGYPLYTMLGILFLELPISFSPAWKVGLVSAVSASAAVSIMYMLVLDITKSKYLSVIACFTLAFTYTFWLFAEIAEVFSLHVLFVLLIFHLTFKYSQQFNKKYLYILSFILGLSLTNNLTIILLFPGVLFALTFRNLKILTDFKTIIKSIAIFALGLIPYVYIPLAASKNPAMNWGRAVNMKNFFYLIIRKDYGWISSKPYKKDIAINAINTYKDYWLLNINILIPLVAIFGLLYLIARKKYSLLVLILTSFFLFGPFYILYGNLPFSSYLTIGTFEKFYLSSIVVSTITFPLGIKFILMALEKLPIRKTLKRFSVKLTLVVFLIIPIASFLSNFKKTDFSNIHIGDDFAYDILLKLPKNSVVILTSDTMSFNSIYLQIAYGTREDVYIPGMQEGFYYIIEKSGIAQSKNVDEYIVENRGKINSSILYASIAPMVKERDVFADNSIELYDNDLGKIISIPYGLLYKLEFEDDVDYSKEKYLNTILPLLNSYHTGNLSKYESLVSYNLIFADIQKLYSISYFRTANYVSTNYDDIDTAKTLLKKSIELDPSSADE
jgi:hypothetical protein